MEYKAYKPIAELASLVKLFWTLEITNEIRGERQRVVPDGCIEMIFNLGEDIKRYSSDGKLLIQPRAFILGQITQAYYVEPIGYVNSFAVRFYPYGFASFVSTPIKDFSDTETPLHAVFGKDVAKDLMHTVTHAPSTRARIEIIEDFLLGRLKRGEVINNLVKATVDTMLATNHDRYTRSLLKRDASERRQLERSFLKQVGTSPKQLDRVIRLQTAMKAMLKQRPDSLSSIAYQSDYYDQAHFNKDFKDFTGSTPGEFFDDKRMELSWRFYE